MKLAYTSDIHIDVSDRNREAARKIGEAVEAHRPDVFVLAGDAGNTLEAIGEALSYFERLDAVKFFVPGNHDVWIENKGPDLLDSRVKFAEWIPAVCRASGFHDLGREPVVIGDVGFVGSLGWYDYTFADPRLALAEDDYWRGRYGDDIWWDKKMSYWVPALSSGSPDGDINVPQVLRSRKVQEKSAARGLSRERMRDREVCAEMAERLEMHLTSIEDRVKTIVAVIHTLPFFVGIPRSEPPRYLDAFTGSERIGRVLEAHPKVRHCIHGHKHTSGEWTAGGMRLYRRVLGRIEEADASDAVAQAVGLFEI